MSATFWHGVLVLNVFPQPFIFIYSTPVLLRGKSHGWSSLEGCGPWGHWGLDKTERLHFHFSLSRIEERNGNLLQCSCLENPRDGGAWWAAAYGVAQSRTRLKRLSSSSSPCLAQCWMRSQTFKKMLKGNSEDRETAIIIEEKILLYM